MPSRSLQLNLVVDVLGRSTLETAAHPDAGSLDTTSTDPATVPVGWMWAQPFPGTACLLSHRDPSTLAVSYRVILEGAREPGDAVSATCRRSSFPAESGLDPAIEKSIGTVRGPRGVTPPLLRDLPPEVFVEPPAMPPPPRSAVIAEGEVPPCRTDGHTWRASFGVGREPPDPGPGGPGGPSGDLLVQPWSSGSPGPRAGLVLGPVNWASVIVGTVG